MSNKNAPPIEAQLESLGEQLGAILKVPAPKAEPVQLSSAVFTQEGWAAWAGQESMPAWLQSLSAQPHWLVLGCAGVLGLGVLWLALRTLRWMLMILVPLALVAVVAWALWFFFIATPASQ